MKPVIVETSAGAIIFRKNKGKVEFLLLQSKLGKGFPKGHVEPGESLKDTAKREVFEETGLGINKFDLDFKTTYFSKREYDKDISEKTVHLYLYERDFCPLLNKKEHFSHDWFTLKEIKDLGLSPNLVKVATEANDFINNLK